MALLITEFINNADRFTLKRFPVLLSVMQTFLSLAHSFHSRCHILSRSGSASDIQASDISFLIS